MQLYSVSDEYINYLRKKYDVKNESDQAYKDLINEEIIYIRKHEKMIAKNAKILYSKRKYMELWDLYSENREIIGEHIFC